MGYQGPLYIGFDLSTQQLKGIVIDSNLTLHQEAKVSFDDDFQEKYGIEKGVLSNSSEGEIYAPVGLWLDALDLVLKRLHEDKCDFSLIKGVCGAGMQHGTVFWSKQAETLLKNLDPSKTLNEQLEPSHHVHDRRGAFSHPDSPNWQDASTQKQCDAFDEELGSTEKLAEITGSKAHHRFSGPQIKRWHQKYPTEWKNTSRISLVSSFLASVLLGRFAPIDISDVCGMNLWHIDKGTWHDQLVKLAAGDMGYEDLEQKLGKIYEDGGASFGNISPYFVKRYGFNPEAQIIPFTGDNPSTILALPLQPADAMVSLGTSTTFLMSTPTWKPDPSYHFFNHPTTAGLYMFMLCYKNGGLAREQVRDAVNGEKKSKSWDKFNELALSTAPMSQKSDGDIMKMGLFFPRPEIVPNVKAGQWRYEYSPTDDKLKKVQTESRDTDAREIIESQFLSLRLRSAALVPEHKLPNGNTLPPQPRRVYLVGGGSANPAIAKLAGEVLGGVEGVYELNIGGNACALGAAYKACWGCERKEGENFEDLIKSRWDEDKFVKRVGDGYREGVFEAYGDALKGFHAMEQDVLKQASEHELDQDQKPTGGVVHADESGRGAKNP